MSGRRPTTGSGLARRTATQRGFTLFELLVSITLFSLITVAIVTAIRVGAHSWEAGDSASSASHDMRLATDLIRTHLRRAYPVVIAERGRPQLLFEGDQTHVKFIGTMSPYLGLGGPYWISLAVVDSPKGAQLVFSRTLFHLDTRSASQDSDESVLVDDVVEARFSYFGLRKKDEARPQWHDEWRDAARLPTLVRVSITSEASGAWPAVVVPVQLHGARYPVRLRRTPTDEEEGVEEEEDVPAEEEAA